ncbi:hypothetical protein V5799_004467 [Amblyomma americanum]|uniref:Uncharacterized protein n=1 Tax=Amblyomma americanum TaxID=6943 RepID=A0AAQ4D611_AMBAM
MQPSCACVDRTANFTDDALTETGDYFTAREDMGTSQPSGAAPLKQDAVEDPEEDSPGDGKDRLPLVLMCVVVVLLVAFLLIFLTTARRDRDAPFPIRRAAVTRAEGQDTGTDGDLNPLSAFVTTKQDQDTTLETLSTTRHHLRPSFTVTYEIATSTPDVDVLSNGTDLNTTVA